MAAAGDDLNEIDALANAARDKLSAAEGIAAGRPGGTGVGPERARTCPGSRRRRGRGALKAEAKVIATKTRIDALRGKIEKLKVALASFARQVYKWR